MSEVMRRGAAFESWLDRVAVRPWEVDLYQVMRRIASAHPELPPLGEALRPVDEPLRVAQPAELDFAPAAVHGLKRRSNAAPLLLQRVFGLLGSNGALPLHLTEYARDRALHHADPTFQRFLDTFTHRFALLFYRAWAEAQPTVSQDRPGNKAYFNRLGSLVGIGLPKLQDRDALPDSSKIHFAGRLARQTRDAEGLLAFIRSEFDVPAAIEPWCGHWMALMRSERSRLGRRSGALLGKSAVIGGTVWDVQHKFRVTLGPLALAQYQRFLPGGADLARLQALVRHWVGLELAWDLKLVLARTEVPRLELGSSAPAEGHDPSPTPEGQHEAELVAVRPTAGDRSGCATLVFRIVGGGAAGAEITADAVPNPPPEGRIDRILGELGVPRSSPASAQAAIGKRSHIAVRHDAGTEGRPRAMLGARTGLGHTTWLGRYLRARDADDLRLDVERPPAPLQP